MESTEFRAPTEEERKKYGFDDSNSLEFRSPTEQERTAYGFDSQEPSFLTTAAETGEDVLTSAAQEASFGFSDEAIAMARAIAESARTGEDRQSLYEKYVDLERQRVKRAQERSPVASTIAGLAGAAAPALISGGASGLVSGTRMLPAAARLLGAGAIGGAVSAVGKSEEELGKETAKEALTGAAEGAAITGAFGVAGKALGAGMGWLGGKIKSSDLGRQTLLARQLAKEGTDLTSEEFETMSKDASKKAAQKIFGAFFGIGTDIEQALASAESKGVRILADESNLSTVEKGVRSLEESNLFGPKTEEIGEKIRSLFPRTDPATGVTVRAGLSPAETNNIRREIRDALAEASEKGKLNVGDAENISELNTMLKGKLNDIEDFKKANEFYEEFARKVPAVAGGKGFEEVTQIVNPVTGLPKTIKTGVKPFSEKDFVTVQKDIESLINKIYAGGTTKKDQVAAFKMLKENLFELEKTKPDLLKRYGIDANEFVSRIEKEADISKIGSSIFGIQNQDDLAKRAGKYASPSGFLYRGAGLVGEAEAAASKIAGKTPSVIKTPLNLAKELYSLPITALGKVGQQLASSPSKKLSTLGQDWVRAAETGDVGLANRISFLILQDPSLRDQVVPYLGEK